MGKLNSVVSECIPMSLVQGAPFRVTNRPVPLPLISMLKILWCCCLNAVLCHSLPLLLHSLPWVCRSSFWWLLAHTEVHKVSAACIFRCLFFTECPAWPITNNPSGHYLLCFVSGLYPEECSKRLISMNIWFISEWWHAAGNWGLVMFEL